MLILKYVPSSEADYIMREIHEDICGNHVRGAIPSIQNLKARIVLAKLASHSTRVEVLKELKSTLRLKADPYHVGSNSQLL